MLNGTPIRPYDPIRRRDRRGKRRTITSEESGQPNQKSRSLQKHGTSHHWNRSSRQRIRTTRSEVKILTKRRNIASVGQILRATNQDGPIGNQYPRKKTEHRINAKDPTSQRIRTVEESSNTQSSGHCNRKKHLRPAGLSSPCRK